MAVLMRVVEMEAHEKECWVKKKQKWTNSTIQEMIDKIPVDFINKYLKNSNRKVYVWMSYMCVFSRKNATKRPRKKCKINGLPPQSKKQTAKETAQNKGLAFAKWYIFQCANS
jgi:hypothetical protein